MNILATTSFNIFIYISSCLCRNIPFVQIIQLNTAEAERHFTRCLFSSIDCSNETKSQKDFYQIQYLSQELNKLLTKSNFVSVICYAIEKPLPTHKNDGSSTRLFSQITSISTFSRLQEVILGLSLTYSTDAQLSERAKHWVRQKLSELVTAHLAVDDVQTGNNSGAGAGSSLKTSQQTIDNYQSSSTNAANVGVSKSSLPDAAAATTSSTSGSLHEIGTELLHFIVSHLCRDSEHYGLTDGMLINFIASLRKDYPRSRTSMVLNTLLYSDIIGHPSMKIYQSELISSSKLLPSVYSSKSNQPSYHQHHTTTTTTSESLVNSNLSTFKKSSICGCGLTSDNPYLLADLLEELGYTCTKTLESIRSVLNDFEPDELSAISIAKCLCLFLRTADGQLNTPSRSNSLSSQANSWKIDPTICDTNNRQSDATNEADPPVLSTWNVENFLTVLLELNPNLQITAILNHLDCPEFMISSRQSFSLFKQIISYAANHLSYLLPTDFFYHLWKNIYGQLSLLHYCCIYPDILCLTATCWPCRYVDLTLYRISVTEDQSLSLQIWKNIDYVQTLLSLSERGAYSEVYQLLKQAFILCPDILTATLLETSFSTLRNVMLGHAFVYFMTNRMNSQIILQTAWNGGKSIRLTSTELQYQRHLLIASCVEYTAQSFSSIGASSEPSTLTPLQFPHSSFSGQSHKNTAVNFTRFVELLASISDDHNINTTTPSNNNNTVLPGGCTILPLLLGTTENSSNTISNLLHQRVTPSSSSNNAASVQQQQQQQHQLPGLPIHLMLPPSHAIDMTLVLVVCMANAVAAVSSSTRTAAGTEGNVSLAYIQTAIKSVLSQWFTEHFRDKITADPFVHGVVEYLRAQYSLHISGNSTYIPRNRLALPVELRKPSLSLLTHIIQSAQAALRSSPCFVSRPLLADVHESLNTLLQFIINSALNRSNNQSVSSSSSSSHSASNSGSAMKTGGAGSTQSHLQTNRLPAPRRKAAAPTSAGGGGGSGSLVGPSVMTTDNIPTLNSNNFLNNFSLPMEHPPMELSFVNEPIKIQLSKEAEAEANTFFQKLLEGISPPDEMFKTLYDFATQGTPAQRKLLDGILRMLADEVSRHLQDYPEVMLPLIADLYGSVLAASTHLFSMRALSMLWRSVLARLFILPPETHMDAPLFRAMVHILMKAKNTFVHFSNLPNCLASCPVFKLFPHDLQSYILNSEIAIKNYTISQQNASLTKNLTTTGSNPSNQLVGGSSSGGAVAGVAGAGSGSGGGHYQQHAESLTPSTSLNLTMSTSTTTNDVCLKAPDAPEESISDRIYFLFNNVSKVNAKEKSNELASLLSEDRLIPWFAFYLVSKRIPVEQTFHDLFAIVLDHIQERVPNVRPKVMFELIRHIKFLLRNMRLDKDDMQARSTLKNFGSFLGLITLARNKPVLHDDLNIKDLIYEAYYKGPIPTQYVVPFVARVVRGATESLVFRPPNPWTMAILKVLRELYDMDNVKDCLRFEIEILYRAFDLNLNEIPSAHFLRDPTHSSNLDIELCFIATTTTTTGTSVTTTGQIVITTTTTSGITSLDTSSIYSGISSSTAAGELSVAAMTLPTTTFSTGPSVSSLSSSSSQQHQQQQQKQQVSSLYSLVQKQQVSTMESLSSAQQHQQQQQSAYSVGSMAAGLDIANLVQNSTGSGANPNRQTAAAFAAAVAAIKKQQFGGPPGTCPSTSVLSMQQHQQQLNAAMAAFQHTPVAAAAAAVAAAAAQQQQQQQAQLSHQQSSATPQGVLPTHNNSLPQSVVNGQSSTATTGSSLSGDMGVGSAGGGGTMFTGHLLRYEDVNIRSIRACLNLDELLTNAALGSRNSGTNPNAIAAAFALLQANPRLRSLIEPAVIRAINELTTPVFERCARITVTTVVASVRKDFALDPDPGRMLYAACQMIRHLAAGMSLITAREALGMSLVTSLKNIILAEVQSATGQEKEAVQQLAYLVVGRSMHVCLAYMQKSVAEKAVKEVEKKLEGEIKLRTELGPIRFMEQAVNQLSPQQSSMPDCLRLSTGGPNAVEMAVYEEFGRIIPGFASSPPGTNTSTSSSLLPPATLNSLTPNQPPISPSAVNSAATMAAYLQLSATQKQQLSSAGLLQRQAVAPTAAAAGVVGSASGAFVKPPYSSTVGSQQQQQSAPYQAPLAGLFDKIIGQIERHLVAISGRLRPANDPMCQSLRCLIDAIHLAKSSRDTNIASNVITVMVQSFLEHYRPSYWRDQPRGLETMEHLKEAHMLTLRHLLSFEQSPFGYAWVTRQVTFTWIHLDGGSGNQTSIPLSSSSSNTGGGVPTSDTLQNQESDLKSTSEKTQLDMTDAANWASSGWKQFTENNGINPGTYENRFGPIKWNWEAFAELLRVHVIYFSQIDAYLSQEVSKGHSAAITFVIDLLDHFILPSPTGTSLGAAAAAAASYARANTSSSSNSQSNPVSTATSSSSSSSSGNVNVPPNSTNTTAGSGGGSGAGSGGGGASGVGVGVVGGPISPSTKREFTVLNEYDLWSTLEALRHRVAYLNNATTANNNSLSSSLTDPLGLRLRLACARLRGLLDLGLMEQSPLFNVGGSGAGGPSAASTISALYAGCSQAHEFDDPPNLQEKVELIMRNWIEIYQSPKQRDPATIEALISQLTQIGVLPNIHNSTRFLRLATIFVIERALKQLKLQEQQQQHQHQQHAQIPNGSAATGNGSTANGAANPAINRVAAYVELDAYARLVTIIVSQLGETPQGEYPNAKVALLNKVLGLIAGTLLQEHEVRRDLFHPMPFERLLVMLFVELQSPSAFPAILPFPIGISPRSDGNLDEGRIDTGPPSSSTTTTTTSDGGNIHQNIETDKSKQSDISGSDARTAASSLKSLGPLTLQQQLPLIFCHLLHCLRPEKATAFVFSWLEMLAHRWFVGRILCAPGPPKLRAAYQAMYAQLLTDLLKFLGYFLQNALMPKPIQCLYKATLRLLLVLIHDFPDFVSDYYALFCDVVPSNSIQMRNIILSALPKRGIPSADPLQAPPVDHLASLEDPTGYCMEAGSRLPEPMRCELDAYLTTRAPVKLLSELVTMLRRADDIMPPLPPPQFAYHPQQQARHQQALAAYAVALAANDVGSSTNSMNKGEEVKSSDDHFTTNQSGNKTVGKTGTSESWEANPSDTSGSSSSDTLTSGGTGSTRSATAALPSTVNGSSSAALAALLWGVRATQQLATFGLADSMHYNIELMTNLTLYVCITAIRSLREKGMPLNMSTIAHTPQMDIIQSLVLNLDNEGRYLLLNCMANQLRYPNSHTYYFSYTILYLFSEQSKEQVKEQISRVLMERLIVNRPHPWGLLMTSAELLRNPAYRFWEHEFARCNPEIEAIVTIVARSCIPNFQIPNVVVNSSPDVCTTSGVVSSGLRYALSSSSSGPAAATATAQGSM